MGELFIDLIVESLLSLVVVRLWECHFVVSCQKWRQICRLYQPSKRAEKCLNKQPLSFSHNMFVCSFWLSLLLSLHLIVYIQFWKAPDGLGTNPNSAKIKSFILLLIDQNYFSLFCFFLLLFIAEFMHLLFWLISSANNLDPRPAKLSSHKDCHKVSSFYMRVSVWLVMEKGVREREREIWIIKESKCHILIFNILFLYLDMPQFDCRGLLPQDYMAHLGKFRIHGWVYLLEFADLFSLMNVFLT